MACPKPERILEWVSIPGEISSRDHLALLFHTAHCLSCRTLRKTTRNRWHAALSPEPDVTDSLIRVYGALKRDETLVLKGWKLAETRAKPNLMLFPGIVATAVLAMTFWVVANRSTSPPPKVDSNVAVPLAQIRFEDKNRVQVHFVRPELLQSFEFETASGQ